MATNSGGVPASAEKQVPKGLWALLILMKAGIDQKIPVTSNVPVDGQPTPQPSLSQELASDLTLFANVADLEAQLKAARAAKAAAMGRIRVRYQDLKQALIVYFGKGNPILAAFGIAARKPRRKLTSAENVLAAGRSESTRTKRGTKGAAAKAAIQGERNVTVTVGPDAKKNVAPAQTGNGAASTKNG